MIRLLPERSWRADSSRTYPSCSIAARTLALVPSPTVSGRLITLETVPTDTPAARATSLMLAAPPISHH